MFPVVTMDGLVFSPFLPCGVLHLTLASIVSLITIATFWIGWKLLKVYRKLGATRDWSRWEHLYRSKSIRTVSQIPSLTHYPFPVPTLVDGLTTALKMVRNGVQISVDWTKATGPLFYFPILHLRFILITDVNLAQKILSSSDPRILNKAGKVYRDFLMEWLAGGLLAAKLPVWQVHRKILNPCFSYKALGTYVKVMDKHAQAFVQGLEAVAVKSGTGVVKGDLALDLMATQSIKIIAEVILGTSSSTFNKTDEFFHAFKKVKSLLMHKIIMETTLRPVWRISSRRMEFYKYGAILKRYINKDIARYRKEMEEKEPEDEDTLKERETEIEGIRPFRSVVEQMLKFNASDKEIYDEVGTFMTAGHDTTNSSMHYFLQHIAEHPELQRKCQEELDGIFETCESQDISLTMEDLTNMKYLERCLMESLRLSPVGAITIRELTDPMEIGGFKFEKGTMLGLSQLIMHRIPEYFPDPERFDPDRWLPERMKEWNRNLYAYMPFSHGARNCIGSKFAMMEMKLMMSWVLRHFDVSTTDKWTDVPMSFQVTVLPRRNYNISLNRREK